ncbi:MAG: glycosyl transferase, partial [Pseudomonadota bacterium]
MADFHQNGSVTTLHNLTNVSLEAMETQLRGFAQTRKITLILPSLFSELEGPALSKIVDELRGADYVANIVIGLDRANEEQFEHAKWYFSRLPQRHTILWNDGPRLKAIQETLKAAGLAPDERGKGQNVWYCIGYVLASQNTDVVALHDCDILTYDREMLARLIYPVANPAFPYQFCKGYYPRIADGKLNGRVSRLLVSPLLMTLQKVCGYQPYIDYLQGFRYPLAGEFAMRTSILPDMRIPSDWGLEIGVLSEVWRNLSSHSVCQVDISDAYDHKHQTLSKDDASRGLSRMSMDISKALFRKLATDGVVFTQETFRTIKATYYRTALDLIEMYYNDAMINGLRTDRHQEEEAVELFAAN